MHTLKTLLADLIRYPSITPHDANCQEYMIAYLEALGFQCLRFNNPPVSNFFAYWSNGEELNNPLFIFAGHTDVVPVGQQQQWLSDPFTLHEQDDRFYGRGVADMKGSLACMMIAAARFVEHARTQPVKGSLGFLITSGEEGDHFDLGTPYVMVQLQAQGIYPQFCVVGEPSSLSRVGDMIKIGRRGSLTATITLIGKQGHVAYPHLADNPIHKIIPALTELTTTQWDTGNTHFPPTSLQMTHIRAGGEANNIIPSELHLNFNFRYSTEHTAASLKTAVEACFARYTLSPTIRWQLNGEPFLTAQGTLLTQAISAIETHTQHAPELSTSGGTSDGRFIAPYGIEVVEIGPVNETIHQVNECVRVKDLEILSDIYYSLCCNILS